MSEHKSIDDLQRRYNEKVGALWANQIRESVELEMTTDDFRKAWNDRVADAVMNLAPAPGSALFKQLQILVRSEIDNFFHDNMVSRPECEPKPIITGRQKSILLRSGFTLADDGAYELNNPPFRCTIRVTCYGTFECITSNCIYNAGTLYGIIAQLICRTEDFDRQTGMRLLANFVND